MSAVLYRTRALMRRRWHAWTGLGIVLGLFAGIVMALAIGARRSDDAYPRFVEQQRAADVVLAGKSSFGLVGSVDLDQIDKMRTVVGHAHAYAVLPFSARIDNGPVLGNADLFPVAGMNEQLGHRVEQWKILDGRAADPLRRDEATASFELARRLHLHVGSVIRFHFYRASTFGQTAVSMLLGWGSRLDRLARDGSGGFIDPADGPSLAVHVVGIEASPLEFPPLITDLSPVLHLTPAFARAYADNIAGSPVDYIRLAKSIDLRAFQLDVERQAQGKPVSFISTLANQQPKVQRSVHAEALVLATLAALVAFAGAVALAQALTRQAYAESGDDPTLRALGMGRGRLLGVALLRATFIALVAVVVATLVAWRLSPRMLLSLARKATLEHGAPANWAAFAIGAASILAFALLVGGLGALAIERSTRRGRVEPRARSARRFGASLRWAWLPLPAAIGARLALQRMRRSAPAWTAIAGIALCLAMLTFASTFTAHLQRDLSEKQRYGWNWDVKIGAPALPDIAGPIVPGLRKQPGLTDLSVAAVTQVEVQGVRVDTLGLDELVGHAVPTITAGRVPRTPDEIALGSRTLRRARVRLGDVVTARIGTTTARYRLVGQAVFPEFGDSGQLGTGSLMTVAGLRRVLPDAPRDAFYIRFARGSDPTARATQLSAVLGPLPAHTDSRPEDLVNLARGDGALTELVILLVALAVAMLGHVLVTTVRAGRPAYATLRALGYTRAQSRRTVLGQAITLAVLAGVIGAPLGLLLGRWVWSTYATRLGIASDPFLPPGAVVLAAGAAAGIACLAAIAPAWLVNRDNAARSLNAGD